MKGTFDVAIIGAGIIGAACANALSREGLRVSIVEQAEPGGGATAASMGHIVVMDDSEAQFALTKYSRELWNKLAPSLPPEVEFQARGTLWVAADDAEMEVVRRKHRFYTERGVQAEVIDPAALIEAEPQLRHDLTGALFVPGDSFLNSPRAAKWFLQQARARGAVLHGGQPVTAINGNELRLADGSSITAGSIVCATGTSAPDLFPGNVVRPRKGHLALTDPCPGFVQHQIVELGYLKSAHGRESESVAFNVQPKPNGQVLIGSSRQFGDTSPSVDPAVLRRMLDRAIAYLPGLARLSIVGTWTGFRAATEDNLPLIGPAGERTYLATGHEGLGITTAPGTAELIVCAILGRKPPIPPDPYLPSRMTQV